MIPLISPTNYTFYKCNKHNTTSAFYKPLTSNMGSLYTGDDLNTDIKVEDVTHLMYGSFDKKLILGSLINLECLCVYPNINLNVIDFYLIPNLKTLFLSFEHIANENLCNLTNGIETLYFNVALININMFDNVEFKFDNLPSNLKKIIFHCGIFTQKYFAKKRMKILNKIKKYKIPFGCKICFYTGDINSYVEESV